MRMLRKFLGNVLGAFLYLLKGRKLLLNTIDETKLLSIYFHNPSVEVFESTIKWLVENEFKIISLQDFKDFYGNRKCAQKKSVFISFDDAWIDNEKLIPVLEKYNIPITLFVAIDLIKEGQIWTNTVRENFAKIPSEELGDLELSNIKELPFDQARNLYEKALKYGSVKRKIMTQEQLVDFSKYATIGSHTVTHPILTNCNTTIIRKELQESKKVLEQWDLGTNNVFAYPNGSYDEKVIEELEKSDYKFAFTTEPKVVDLKKQNNHLTVSRICIPDGFGLYENLARMSTVWSKVFKV